MFRFVDSSFILILLKRKPGYCVVNPDGSKLYALAPTDQVIEFSGRNFKEMTNDEVNQFMIDSINEVLRP